MKTYEFTVSGLVQGIGYRPYIAKMFSEMGICGTVKNSGGIVKIEVTVSEKAVEDIIHRLYVSFPEGARPEKVSAEEKQYREFDGFTITESNDECIVPVLPADISICDSCINELKDRNNRRYHYPFISCASCGPRYTIMYKTPYDRANTTMVGFGMCRNCRKEYEKMGDRRMYAQTNSCPDCGPVLIFRDEKGNRSYGERAYEEAVNHLRSGRAIAVKDTGGYHIAADAHRVTAVAEVRTIKNREKKPFAIMVRDTETAGKYGFINESEKSLLEDAARPIVLVRAKESELCEEVMSGSPYAGIMLPSNGLQYMLADEFEALVMTSANISGEPIITDDEEMLGFSGIGVLYNDRDILTPVDDSIVAVVCGRKQTLRRGRGFVPLPLDTEIPGNGLAFGADMKGAFAFLDEKRIFLSQSFGDLSHERVKKEYDRGTTYMKKAFSFKEGFKAYDAHPLYVSSEKSGRDGVKTYHHRAHGAAVAAEFGIEENVIMFCFDGTGLGENGSMWGSEVFYGKPESAKRISHLREIKLAGGDGAGKKAGICFASYMAEEKEDFSALYKMNNCESTGDDGLGFGPGEAGIVAKAVENNMGVVYSSSMGRLFDAAAFAIGICGENKYEGQCACELEYEAAKTEEVFELHMEITEEENGCVTADAVGLLKDIVRARLGGVEKAPLARGFIYGIAEWVVNVTKRTAETDECCVLFGGGCFANRILLEKCVNTLEKAGYRCFFNREIPPGDDGIAAGQLYLASKYLEKKE